MAVWQGAEGHEFGGARLLALASSKKESPRRVCCLLPPVRLVAPVATIQDFLHSVGVLPQDGMVGCRVSNNNPSW